MQEQRDELETAGFVVLRQAVPPDRVAAALRMLNLAIRREGLSAEEIAHGQSTTFFPDLRDRPEVWGALPEGAGEVLGEQEGDRWAEPQLLLRFPDEVEDWPLEPHIDEVPPWAADHRYRGIIGVALTTAGPEDGTPCVWPRSHREPRAEHVLVPLEAGDALVLHPDLEHAGTLNHGPFVRASIYFRLVGDRVPA